MQLHLAEWLSGHAPFSHLIYPIPEEGGLGVHLTLDLAGQAKFGPDVQWVDDVEYAVPAHRADAFYGMIRKYFPALTDGSLQPSYSGIRPKVQTHGGACRQLLLGIRLQAVCHWF